MVSFVLSHTQMIYTEYYMSKSGSHAVSTQEHYITPRATTPRVDMACDTDFDM
jgi:hypothetical protein